MITIPHRNKLLLFTGAMLWAALPGLSQAQPGPMNTENASVSQATLVDLLDNVTPVPNSSSVMHRSRHGVTVSINTTGLEPNAAITIWFLVFNRPQFCVGNEDLVCDPAAGDLDNPDVQGSVFWGAGRVSDDWGQLNIASTVSAGGETPGQLLFGPGLLDSLGAEIHIVVRGHGSAAALDAAGELEAALTTVGGGCGVNVCEDFQAAAHAGSMFPFPLR